jgi:hypothetical protein
LNGELVLPKHVVKHLYERRVIHDGMSADAVADMVHSVLTSEKSKVAKASTVNRRKLIRVKEGLSRLGVIGTASTGEDVLILQSSGQDCRDTGASPARQALVSGF